eukprot:EC124183.1.p1 GENE.EC124183.1~~EC124183.1.p1  ORF type:complete len:116 (+),score=14.24 EC124183.1:139-486(+)
MEMGELLNPNPQIFEVSSITRKSADCDDEDVVDGFDSLDIFDLIRDINDPEHPLTLEQLKVVQHELIKISDKDNEVMIKFTPTIPHCSMATLIGLCIRVKLLRSLPKRFKGLGAG